VIPCTAPSGERLTLDDLRDIPAVSFMPMSQFIEECLLYEA
jgi:hypothetical protein